MQYATLTRSEKGTQFIYEVESILDRVSQTRILSSYAARSGAKLKYETLNAFDSGNRPRYLLKVTVAQQGRAKEKAGRKALTDKQERSRD